METNNKIDGESSLIDLIKNKFFLDIFDEFIHTYTDDESFNYLENNGFINYVYKLTSLIRKGNYSDIDENELYEFLGKFFSDSSNLFPFLEYVKLIKYLQKGKGQKEFNMSLEIGDLLLSIYNKKDRYSEDSEIIKSRLKDKVKDTLGKTEIKNVILKLTANGYPCVFGDNEAIFGVDFNDYFELTDGTSYIKVFDKEKNEFYINKLGNIFLSNDGHKIKKIHYVFNFGDYTIFKYIDENFKEELKIFNLNGNMLHTGNDAKKGTLENDGKILYYLLLTNKRATPSGSLFPVSRLYNENFEKLSLLELLKFLNGGEKEFNNSEFLSRENNRYIHFSDVTVSEIGNNYNFHGKKFLDLAIFKEEIYLKGIIDFNGKFLKDGDDYIQKLYDITSIEGYNFISFGDNGFLTGCIDANNEVIYIDGIKCFTVSKLALKKGDEEYYSINNDKGLIVPKTKLLENLQKYTSIDILAKEKISTFSLKLEAPFLFSYKDLNISEICGTVKGNYIRIAIITSNSELIPVEYIDLISKLNNGSVHERGILKVLNELISNI